MTGSHVGRALFFARSLAFDAGGKKKSKTHSPPLLPLLSDLFLPFLRSLSPWRSPRPSSGEYLGIRCARAGSVGEGFLFSLSDARSSIGGNEVSFPFGLLFFALLYF